MNVVTLTLMLVLCSLHLEVSSMPLSPECSSILSDQETTTTTTVPPPSTTTPCSAKELGASDARDILLKLQRILDNATSVYSIASLSDVNDSELNKTFWRQGPSEDESDNQKIAASVYRMKCITSIIAEIGAKETIRDRVKDGHSTNFVDEFLSLMSATDVIHDLNKLVSSYATINGCSVPNSIECTNDEIVHWNCSDYFQVDNHCRDVMIKTTAFVLKNYMTETKMAFTNFLA